ncbi:hypothetical protein LJR231_001561 [Phyllobacterium sp. LjRoot231]|uniref:hypothetical protein n=1 Tax=Phyllobacterium sp. LjRoot231 TaxID=3342289 RepID=UPI003ED09432
MSSLGIGLGAFMGGFENGYNLGDKINKDKRADKLQAEADASTERLKGIETDTQAKFDQGVKDGTQDGSKFDDFWLKYALPQRKMEMLKQGKVAEAKDLMDWGQSEDTLKGGRLFASSLFKAQNGDAEGAFNDAIKAGQLKGYIDHGYEFDGKDDLQQNGQTIGFRVRLKGPDGKITTQDIPKGQLGEGIARWLSPDAAIAQNAATRAAATKRQQDLEDYTTKKQVDLRYAPDKKDVNAEAYGKVQENLLKNDLDFADLSPEDQDKKIRANLAAADQYSADRSPGLGRPTNRPAPPQKVIIDTQSGQPVQAPAQAAPPAPQQAAPAQQPGLGGQAQAAPAPTPAPNPNNINSSMAPGSQGEIRRGPDGRTYQYAETTGMAGATGDQGWIPVADTGQQSAPAPAQPQQASSAAQQPGLGQVPIPTPRPSRAAPTPTPAGQPMTMAGVDVKGLVTPGNIDLTKRPVVKNADGSISTVRSMSFQNNKGQEVLIPTVADDGSRILSDDEAKEQYGRTGKHLGIFDNPDDATAYAESLHSQQEQMYAPQAQSQSAPTKEDMIADAADYMSQGGNPNAIAQRLVNAGISPEEWPTALKQAVQKARTADAEPAQ